MLAEFEVSRFINDQKKVLLDIAFPFVIQVGRTFQTEKHLFYLEEHVSGEDFYEVLRSIGLLSTDDSQFYTASIILILEYFEDNRIICRDLKP